jgi:hypothetical protein
MATGYIVRKTFLGWHCIDTVAITHSAREMMIVHTETGTSLDVYLPS